MKGQFTIFVFVVASSAFVNSAFLPRTGCNRVLSTSSGFFSSENESCQWRITAAPGEKIFLHITDLNIDKSENCTFGHIEIRNGFWYNSPLLGKFCGEGRLDPISSTTNKMLVSYVSKNPQKEQGFSARYKAICGDTLFIEGNAILESPEFPEEYPHNRKCIWKIIVPENHRVVLEFQTFHLENYANCIFDYLEIRDGRTNDSDSMGVFCGQNKPSQIISTGNSLWIKFVSDFSIQRDGFSAIVKDEYDECATPDHGCAHECINTMGSYKCACRLGFELHSNGRDCEAACGGVFDASNGTITSPSFPDLYQSNKTCIWEIVASPQNRIVLNFIHFDLNWGRVNHPKKHRCNADRVEIFNKFEDNSTQLHGVYCGNATPEMIISESTALRIVFKSDSGVGKTGFELKFSTVLNRCGINNGNCRYKCLNTLTSTKCICDQSYILENDGRDCRQDCNHEISSLYGTITNPNHVGDYSSYLHCTWLFTTTPGHRIEISFNSLRIENSNTISLYDGSSSFTPLLRKFINVYDTQSEEFSSSSNQLYMILESMTSWNYIKFEAEYTSICGGTLQADSSEKYIYSHPTFGTSNYDDNITCEWTITPKLGCTTSLFFTTFELEDGNASECIYDHVEISETIYSSTPQKYCGLTAPPQTITSKNSFVIRFVSDDSVTSRGFSLTYQAKSCTNNFVRTFEYVTFPSTESDEDLNM